MYQGVRNVSFSEDFANIINEWFPNLKEVMSARKIWLTRRYKGCIELNNVKCTHCYICGDRNHFARYCKQGDGQGNWLRLMEQASCESNKDLYFLTFVIRLQLVLTVNTSVARHASRCIFAVICMNREIGIGVSVARINSWIDKEKGRECLNKPMITEVN